MKINLIETLKMLDNVIPRQQVYKSINDFTELEQAVLIVKLFKNKPHLIDTVAALLSNDDNLLKLLKYAVNKAKNSNSGTKSTSKKKLNKNPGMLTYHYINWSKSCLAKGKKTNQNSFILHHIINNRCIVDGIDYGTTSTAKNNLAEFKRHSKIEQENELALIEENEYLKPSLTYKENDEIVSLKLSFNNEAWLIHKMSEPDI